MKPLVIYRTAENNGVVKVIKRMFLKEVKIIKNSPPFAASCDADKSQCFATTSHIEEFAD